MWNLCLPLLQKDFRKAIKAPLNLVAVALADIDRYASVVGKLLLAVGELPIWGFFCIVNHYADRYDIEMGC